MKIFLQLRCCFMLLAFSSTALAQDFNLTLRSKLVVPGETTRGVWGYVQDGREYALMSANKGMIIADVTDPDTPWVLTKIPDTTAYVNLQEIQTYGHYAYSATNIGLLIVDLSALPDSNLAYKFYNGDGPIAGQMHSIHTLHIDVKKGFLYANSVSNLAPVVILDLNADPFNPTYAGKVSILGTHDCYVDNDTMYGANFGVMSIIDVADKSNPVLLGTAPTPGGLTHNAWLLDNHQFLLTTDESTPSFLTAFDISDPADIKEMGRVSPNDGYETVAHNTQVLNDWAITGWYKDGVVVVDAHRPENLVVVGRYDTWLPDTDLNFFGCWGVYSYLPSGNILAGNYLPGPGGRGELFVFKPDYRRACYLEGNVTNMTTGSPVAGAIVEIIGNTYSTRLTAIDGVFKTGQTEEGVVQVSIRKDGFCADTVTAVLIEGQVTILNVAIAPCPPFTISGYVKDSATGAPVPVARVLLRSFDKTYETNADAAGFFTIPNVYVGKYDIYYGAWGWNLGTLTGQNFYAADDQIVLPMTGKLYYDDFFFNLFWGKTGLMNKGKWVLAKPEATYLDSSWNYVNDFGAADTIHFSPGNDVESDANDRCYVTGNENPPHPWFDDVDGTTTLTSPLMQLANYQDAVLSFWYWFFDEGKNFTSDNQLEVQAISNGDTVTVFSELESAEIWRFSGDIHLTDYITLSDDLRIRFIVSTNDPDVPELFYTKAAMDIFKVAPEGLISNTITIEKTPGLTVFPNPAGNILNLRMSGNPEQAVQWTLFDVLGRVVQMRPLDIPPAGISVNIKDLIPGVYFYNVRDLNGRWVKSGNFCKQ